MNGYSGYKNAYWKRHVQEVLTPTQRLIVAVLRAAMHMQQRQFLNMLDEAEERRMSHTENPYLPHEST